MLGFKHIFLLQLVQIFIIYWEKEVQFEQIYDSQYKIGGIEKPEESSL